MCKPEPRFISKVPCVLSRHIHDKQGADVKSTEVGVRVEAMMDPEE